jgi:hypothetical protein
MISTSLMMLSTSGAADDIVGTSTLGADPAGISAVMLGDVDLAGAALKAGAAGADLATDLATECTDLDLATATIGVDPVGVGRGPTMRQMQ